MPIVARGTSGDADKFFKLLMLMSEPGKIKEMVEELRASTGELNDASAKYDLTVAMARGLENLEQIETSASKIAADADSYAVRRIAEADSYYTSTCAEANKLKDVTIASNDRLKSDITAFNATIIEDQAKIEEQKQANIDRTTVLDEREEGLVAREAAMKKKAATIDSIQSQLADA